MNALTPWLNEIAPRWGGFMLQAAWQASLVALLLLGAVALMRRRSSPLRYGFLLIALLKFAVPPMLALPTGLFSRTPAPASMFLLAPAPMPHELGMAAPGKASPGAGLSREAPAGRPRAARVPAERLQASAGNAPDSSNASSNAAPRLTLFAWLMLAHGLGMAAIGLCLLRQMISLARLTSRAESLTGGEAYELYAALGSRLGLRRLPRLLVLDAGFAPVAFGVLRPVVLLPRQLVEKLDPAQLRAVLGHELAHHRRRDPVVIVFQLLLLVVWWFNPVFWMLLRALRKVREDCCDDLLLSRELTSCDTYCETLLRTGRELTLALPAGATLGFAERMHPLARRLRRIMDASLRRAGRLSLAGLLLVLLLGAALLPGAKGRGAQPPKTATPQTAGKNDPAIAATPSAPAATSVSAPSPAPRTIADIKPPFTFKIHVLTPDGKPQAGVTIQCRHPRQERGEPLVNLKAASNENGVAEFNVTQGDLTRDRHFWFSVADGAFIGSSEVGISPLDHEFETTFKVAPAENYSIRVADEKGRPIPGAALWLVSDRPNFPVYEPGQFETMASAKATSAGLAVVRFANVPANITASAPGHAATFIRGATLAADKPYEIRLDPGFTIRGKVVDDQGKTPA